MIFKCVRESDDKFSGWLPLVSEEKLHSIQQTKYLIFVEN
jgi:hypothetical protein